jgi:hypothetical protein
LGRDTKSKEGAMDSSTNAKTHMYFKRGKEQQLLQLLLLPLLLAPVLVHLWLPSRNQALPLQQEASAAFLISTAAGQEHAVLLAMQTMGQKALAAALGVPSYLSVEAAPVQSVLTVAIPVLSCHGSCSRTLPW